MMEARSLTSLNQLAANPPQYPINPSETKQEPLTLYLSRVPGTRDVILSPFKPQLKSVTNQDVASSLYYVHHEIAPPPQQAPIREYRSSSDSIPTPNAIPRKPLPGTARPLTPEPTSTQDRISVPNDPTRRRGLSASAGYDAAQASRSGPVESGVPLSENAPEPKSRPTPELMAPLARRPTGPRPMTSPGPNPPPIGAHKDLPPVPRQLDDPVIERRPVPNRGQSRSTSPGKSGDSTFTTPFTLTLIRRDPSTGNQWNVGRISSYQEDAQNDQDEYTGLPLVASAPPPASSGRPPISIQLETLGYAKFRHMPAKRSMDTSPSGIRDVIANMSLKDGGQGQSEGVTFARQVVMGYSKSFATNLREKWHQIEQGRSNQSHMRQASVTSVGSTGSTGSNEDTPDVVTQPGPGLKPRGYLFSSPWDGRCEFRTGNAGRSVRCVHILHDDDTSAFNPLVGGGPAAIGPIQGGSMTVSELRFNLPSGELFKTAEGRRDAKAQLKGNFNKLLNRKNDGSDEDDGTVSPFEMNLGRERAGGGNRGKRAKLGKLIIYNDGLKMLDLIVAANMGVWWGAWERSF